MNWEELYSYLESAEPYSVKELDAIGDKINTVIEPGVTALMKGFYAAKDAVDSHDKAASRMDELYIIYKKADAFSTISNVAQRGFSSALKGVGGKALRTMPYVGLIPDIILVGKNIVEAVKNGYTILAKLPLQKFGISKELILTPTTDNIRLLFDDLTSKIAAESSPDNIKELYEIAVFSAAFKKDFVSILVNYINFILNIIDTIATTLSIGTLKPLTGWINFALSLPFAAIEMANDSLVDESFDSLKTKTYEKILENI